MANILDAIAANAGASDSTWVDLVVQSIQTNAAGIQQPEFKSAVIEATLTLAAHKDDVASLGVYGLTLFLQKIAIGDTEGAYISFIETQASFQDLINGENADAATIIAAEKQRDEMHAKAVAVMADVAVNTARVLLPFLLTLLI